MWQLLSSLAWQVTVGVLSLLIGAETVNSWCAGDTVELLTPRVTPRINASTPRTSSIPLLPDPDADCCAAAPPAAPSEKAANEEH